MLRCQSPRTGRAGCQQTGGDVVAVGGRGLRLRQVVGIAAGYTGVVLLVLADLVLMLLLLLLLLLLSLLYLLELLGRLSELLYLETNRKKQLDKWFTDIC